MFKAWHKWIFFTCSEHSNIESGQSLFFLNIIFSTKCAPFFIDFFYEKHIWLKKNFDFENCELKKYAYNKNNLIYMIKAMNLQYK